jgi:hypothetical protein
MLTLLMMAIPLGIYYKSQCCSYNEEVVRCGGKDGGVWKL